MSARLRLTLSYAGFLLLAGAAVLAGVYVVLRFVPNYPLTAANPRDPGGAGSRGEILDAMVKLSGAILAALAVIGLAGGWLLAGWILRPLQDINAAARIAATGRLDHRIRLGGRSDEFKQLADNFDDMLGRLDQAFGRQERFAANASHELRTPLAVTATLIDVAQAAPEEQDYPQLLERLKLTNARAIGLTEALLRLADANAVTAASEPVDLATIAADAVADTADEAEGRGVTLEERLEPAQTVGDATLLAQLAANLVQNAVRHNVPGGHARVSTAGPVLRVTNSGRVYSPAEAARLVEPFLRGNGRTGGGHGLGLTLVARIAELHGGTLDVEARREGGLAVTVTFSQNPRRRAP